MRDGEFRRADPVPHGRFHRGPDCVLFLRRAGPPEASATAGAYAAGRSQAAQTGSAGVPPARFVHPTLPTAMKARIWIPILALAVVAALVLWACLRHATAISLTGIVTTDEVIVSAEISGRLQQLLVKEGDTVTNGQLLAVIQPQEWKADAAYYKGREIAIRRAGRAGGGGPEIPGGANDQSNPPGGSHTRRHPRAGHPGRGRPGERRSDFQTRRGPFQARRGFAPDLRSGPHHTPRRTRPASNR
jgi:biotin carboxyl carrier protein